MRPRLHNHELLAADASRAFSMVQLVNNDELPDNEPVPAPESDNAQHNPDPRKNNKTSERSRILCICDELRAADVARCPRDTRWSHRSIVTSCTTNNTMDNPCSRHLCPFVLRHPSKTPRAPRRGVVNAVSCRSGNRKGMSAARLVLTDTKTTNWAKSNRQDEIGHTMI